MRGPFLFSPTHLTVVFQQWTASVDVVYVNHHQGEDAQTREGAHDGAQESRSSAGPVHLSTELGQLQPFKKIISNIV